MAAKKQERFVFCPLCCRNVGATWLCGRGDALYTDVKYTTKYTQQFSLSGDYTPVKTQLGMQHIITASR